MTLQRIAILGSTGSVGTQALDVLARFKNQYQVVSLTANQQVSLLAEQIMAFNPEQVVVGSDLAKEQLLEILNTKQIPSPQILVGTEGLVDVAANKNSDVVLNALVGFTGLEPTFAALKSGKKLLTGNKETIVCAGHLLKPYLKQIFPLDSEHSAIQQCLAACQNPKTEVRKIILTASGGPFINTSVDELKNVTPKMALAHPNWQMGERITIDCATMMNKGFEWIEASVLFDLPLDDIEVVIHPQSIIHSAVAFKDGSVLSQMGQPDMRIPIIYGLSYPERWELDEPSIHLDITQLSHLEFKPVEHNKYPCLTLAYQAAKMGGSMPTVLNAADEILVKQFLNGKIKFTEIAQWVEKTLEWHQPQIISLPSLDEIITVDAETRQWLSQKLQPLVSV